MSIETNKFFMEAMKKIIVENIGDENVSESSKKPYFFLTQKEEEAMKVLWASEEPLSGAEIAERIPGRTWPPASIHNILRVLQKKQAIEVAEIKQIGKVYGRLFRAALTPNEYAVMQFRRFNEYSNENNSLLISALLGDKVKIEKHKEVSQMLEALLDKYKE